MSTPRELNSENHDEIDLRDLALMLIEGWYWIVGSVVVALIAAFSYLMVSTTIYETSFRAVPASSSNFSGFNLFNGFTIMPNDAYRTLGNQLSSFQNFEAYVDENRARFELDEGVDLGRTFNSRLSISGLTSDLNGSATIEVHYRYPEGEQGDEIINDYVRDTSEKVWEALRNRFNDYSRVQIANLDTRLDLQKESLQSSREERLFELEQAITVARRLDIEKPTTPQQFGRELNSNEVIYADIDSGGSSLPLYFLGYEALEADRDSLREAIDQGLSNSAIRETRQQREQLLRVIDLLDSGQLSGVDKDVELNHTERVVDVVEYAYPPANPSEPRKALILMLSLLLGGMLGVMLVFVHRFTKSLRHYKSNKIA
jgi:LPS O-antigen subunit length determinant protein (WzzB/FepE family)